MNIRHHVDLSAHTTFGVRAICDQLITVQNVAELSDALATYPEARILGGGSNILLHDDVHDAVILMDVKGIERNDHHVTVMAGETWHGFVSWCVDHRLGGLENLALIPGTVGAAPMQNIGAYGVEQDACCVDVTVMDRHTRQVHTIAAIDCDFGYRTSRFKRDWLGTYVILSVTYQLMPEEEYRVQTQYRDVQEELAARSCVAPTMKDVFDAVVAIRQRKLPDPASIGNAGSFFQNPVIDRESADRLRNTYPDMPQYVQDDGTVKLAAAWLIDQCGWKGIRRGDAGVHDRQALVLVNYGAATGAEILSLATEIRSSVWERFAVALHMEVNVW